MTSIEIPPTVRMIATILDHVEQCFAESGCPLNVAQTEVLQDARRLLDRMAEQVDA